MEIEKYIVLLRWINVGGNNKVSMKQLIEALRQVWYQEVFSYINSGNILLSSSKKREAIQKDIKEIVLKQFDVACESVVKTKQEIEHIAAMIPADWQNNAEQKTDVAFLFSGYDAKDIVAQLPWDTTYMHIIPMDWAICWNVLKKEYNKSRLSKIISHTMYKQMTVRNINTVRVLADM